MGEVLYVLGLLVIGDVTIDFPMAEARMIVVVLMENLSLKSGHQIVKMVPVFPVLPLFNRLEIYLGIISYLSESASLQDPIVEGVRSAWLSH